MLDRLRLERKRLLPLLGCLHEEASAAAAELAENPHAAESPFKVVFPPSPLLFRGFLLASMSISHKPLLLLSPNSSVPSPTTPSLGNDFQQQPPLSPPLIPAPTSSSAPTHIPLPPAAVPSADPLLKFNSLRPSKSAHELPPSLKPPPLAPHVRHSGSTGQTLATVLSQQLSDDEDKARRQQSTDFSVVELSSSSRNTTRSSRLANPGSLDLSGIPHSHEWSLGSGEFRSGSFHGSGRRDPDKRIIYINNPEKTNDRYEYSGNKVRTNKYTFFSFIPKNLFEQFHRIAYVYFLLILCLNQIPQLAVFGRFASLLPLIFVLVVTAVKDGYEDWRRHRSDKKENNRSAMIFVEGQYERKPWKHVQVGEMVKILANETIPCDLVLLRTSDPNGVAYVQTINLDGESNLKTRYARLETSARLEAADKQPDQPPIGGKVVCEKPNRNIYGFTAFAELDGKQLPLGPTNIILRGCELKNTSWAIGVAVYTGPETKVMLNSAGAQSKRSLLEHKMNRETLLLSLFLFITCFVPGLGMGLWLKRHEDQLNAIPSYGQTHDNYFGYYGKFGEAIFSFLSSLISFQIMIPISLYISMELVRLGQSYFMIQDVEMYHSETNTRLQCRALNINEDLGQVKYVFSDKTGTLTENKMEFRCASIFGESYEMTDDPEDSVASQDRQVVNEVLGNLTWKPKAGVKVDPRLVRVLQDSTKSLHRTMVHDYLLTLAACNTVVPTKVKLTSSGNLEMEVALAADEGTPLIEYQGESPDEQALVAAAASYGYTLLERTSNYIVINVLGERLTFEVLGMHEFDSNRKCMSVILRCPDGGIKVVVKGADSAVLRKLSLSEKTTHIGGEYQSQVLFDTQMHLDLYSKKGLRTLVVGARELSDMELVHWQRLYAKANASVTERMALLQEAAQAIEKDLVLLGATGIEDKLQAGVPEAISTLRDAGIKVWVLTGDKQETAISIGFSCALLTHDMKQIIINESEKQRCGDAIRAAKAAYVLAGGRRQPFHTSGRSVDSASGEQPSGADRTSEHFAASPQSLPTSLSQTMRLDSLSGRSINASRAESVRSERGRILALIIDGTSLVHALEEDLEQELFDLATACQVVICCRVAPLQKAGIVSLVKRKSKEMTLAIGDGANDVSMIQMADVGVGISGQEGRQAVLASDFAMGQFRFLRRLLLIHGHLNYRRMGYMVLYNFYRNAVFVMLLFWYTLHTAFSTSPPITEWSLVLYSVIYTSVPTVVVAIMDRNLSHETLLKHPSLYRSGQRNESYSRTLFWLTMLDTLWQSLVLFYVPFFTYRCSNIDIWSIGSIWIIAVVVLVNLHLAMDIEHYTWITHVALWGSIVATYICLIVLDVLTDPVSLAHYGTIFHVASTAGYWLDILLIVILALLPRFCIKVMKLRCLMLLWRVQRESSKARCSPTAAHRHSDCHRDH
ncbi:hypothetical protein GOP47_0011630 [Adiantum capillus-veneris]|uniref:Phospholipid-transporting ATPase n=1 Tax=Adiantum capillus-veneris TaxID=13818 RepID=A0A9D4UUJ0_ADICA|nr:hypothetical protein GOP47_0011630 [Adiantum capillus-veneris]